MPIYRYNGALKVLGGSVKLRNTGNGWGLLIAFATVLAGVASGYQFLPQAEFGDGFAMQISTAQILFIQWGGSDLLDESWLPLVHVARLVAVTPFLVTESVFGAFGPLALLLLLLWPLTQMPLNPGRSFFTLLPLLLPVLVSGRSVLVAVSVGLIAMHLIESRHSWMLWVGGILCNLSSASVLMVLLLLLFSKTNRDRVKLTARILMQRIIVFAMLLSSLAVSALDKIVGFSEGNIGYQAHAFDTENLLLQVISRSTLAVSLFEGQYMRAFVYVVIAALLLASLFMALCRPNQHIGRRIVLCCAPGILLEGLGAMAMLFPLIWLLRAGPIGARQSALPVSRVL